MICPNCRSEIGSQSPCPYCGTAIGLFIPHTRTIPIIQKTELGEGGSMRDGNAAEQVNHRLAVVELLIKLILILICGDLILHLISIFIIVFS